MSAWLPGVGECCSRFSTFKSKADRDYAASQAPKAPRYIKHSVGTWKVPYRPRTYWLSVHFRTAKKADQ